MRLSIAQELNLPPYVIFHDRTLQDMAVLKPRTERELSMIGGVGAILNLKNTGMIFKGP